MAQRIQKWDILKFFLMFTVVLGHFFENHTETSQLARGMFLIIYSFHMPLFIFVSGLFSKRTVNEKRWDKMLGYLVLTFATKLIIFIFNAVLRQNFTFSTFGDKGLPWFMFALFVFFVITVFAKNYKPQYVLAFSVILALLVGYDNDVNYKFVLSRIIVYYPFFYLGYIADVKKLEEFCHGKIKKVVSFAAVTVWSVALMFIEKLYPLRILFTGQNPYKAFGEWRFMGFALRLCYYAAVLVVGLAIIVLIPDKFGKGIIAEKGQYTMPVYMFHYAFVMLLYSTLDLGQYFDKWWKLLIFFPLSFVITFLLSNKLLNKLVNTLTQIPTKAKIKNK